MTEEDRKWIETNNSVCAMLRHAHDVLALSSLPPAPRKKPWVGLTRMELIKCGVLPFGMSYELCQAIEAKLKEKNT